MNMRMKSYDLRIHLNEKFNEENIATINRLFSIHCMADDALPILNFTPSEGWSNAIKPSEYGLELISKLGIEENEFSADEISFALLLAFYHQDFLIDISTSSYELAEDLLRKELFNNKIRLANRFGRTLYDRFNDTLGQERPETLTAEAVDALLGETEQGIYQVGTLTVGPLGPLQSRDRRFIPPSLELPLWHCSDTGCGHLHSVDLTQHDSPSYDLASLIAGIARELHGPASDWYFAFVMLGSHSGHTRSRPYYDLPALIADCIPFSEREFLCIEAIRGKTGPSIRQTLSSISKKLPQGSAEAISKNLSALAQLQLLLTLKDTELVNIIDDCVRKKLIKIPPTEIRSPEFTPPKLSSFYRGSTICMFGVRVDNDNPPIQISNAVWEEYKSIDQLDDLAWRCKRGASASSHEAGGPLEYIISHDPRKFVKYLILPSRPVTLALASKFHIQIYDDEPEEQLIDRILWKFGFDVPRYDQKYGRMKVQLRQFRDEILRHRSSLSADDRDAIRSRGVNVFVTLENILEEILSFNLWLLSSDHFVNTKFKYYPPEAVSQVADVLGDKLSTGNHEVTWNRNGGNALGTLLVFARAAARWMTNLSDLPKNDLERPSEELPHYIGEISQHFRFRHKELWADAAPNQLREFAQRFSDLISDFEMSKLAEIRNGLDHYRNEDRFPSVDALVACESRLSAAIDISDINRFIPKYFWMHDIKTDSFGRSERTMIDYAGNKIAIRTPQPIVGLSKPTFGAPVIVPFGNLLGMPNSDLVVYIREESDYAKFWDNYPRRPYIGSENLSSLNEEGIEIEAESAELLE